MNFHTCNQLLFKRTTLIWSVCLSRTSILALMPLFSIKLQLHQLGIKVYANVRFLEEMFDISNKLSAISREKISRLKRSSASLRAFSPMRCASSGWSAM